MTANILSVQPNHDFLKLIGELLVQFIFNQVSKSLKNFE